MDCVYGLLHRGFVLLERREEFHLLAEDHPAVPSAPRDSLRFVTSAAFARFVFSRMTLMTHLGLFCIHAHARVLLIAKLASLASLASLDLCAGRARAREIFMIPLGGGHSANHLHD